VVATASGELFLAPNDEWYLVWGNAGSLTVSICVGASGGASAPVAWRPGGPAIPPSPAPVIVASGLLALLAVAMGTRRRRRVVGAAVVLCLLVPATALAQTTTQVIEYYTTDALGSVRAVTKKVNGQWTVVARHDYMPFGEEVAPPSPPQDKRLFTGKERDNETGMDYFGARYYRADVGRFTTVDPVQTISENLTDPQRWNRYSYVRNNPLRYTDPDGRLPVEPWKASGHTDLTTAAMSGQGGLSSQDVARAVEANIAVDALSNQTNDPAHYMPGTGAEATKLIDQLLDTAVKAEVGGRHSEAMKALGQALHTVQDRYAHDAQNAGWLAHMNGSAPDNPAKHPKEYQDAKRASQEFVQRYLAEVKKKRESEPNSSPEKR
jgi:RHS repeat-associated protein